MAAAADRQVFETAASWYVQFQSQPPSLAEQKAWQLWIDSDPAHLAAWNQMEQLQRHLGTLPQDLKRRALNSGQQRRQVLKLLLLAAGTGFVGWNVQRHTSLGNVWADYKTGVGQRRTVSLADGSQIQLNTDSAVDVSFDAAQRMIHLRCGEILVQTGKLGDPRPFYVQTRDGRIQALGTRFSVHQLSSATRVGVLEDRVSVQPAQLSTAALILKAGEGADFDSRHIGLSHPFQASEVAWINGQLIVLDARLGTVLEELGRYRSGVLHCDRSARDLRVSGTFRLDSTDAVLANLQASLPINVRYFSRYWVSISHSVD
ncbi:iron transporter [Pseudomonas sp. CFBP13508]|uniref:FecR domain-containing protein n=1 Tax=Pseudomonas sp. CFBP13508 TaxID=2184009 RepID=UPI0010BFEB95|nr:FecR domain-containing protein [Pseudomonas sp. CFBP13508]TKJ72931.1 iron transporter [Pseudomonas sp. CFBP13508]